jgi:HD-GYP domain-containing protein (c-di-GMP phosphodiesterase class II)
VALLATELAERAGCDEDERRRALYLALARHIGCTGNAEELAVASGDEIGLRQPGPRLDLADPKVMLPHILRHVGAVNPLHRRPMALARLLSALPSVIRSTAAVCETASTLARRMGLPPESATDIPLFFERWDGKGFPGDIRGDALPLPVQVVQVAEAAESLYLTEGGEAACTLLRRRSGAMFAPPAVDVFLAHSDELFDVLETAEPWEAVLASEPAPYLTLDEEGVDRTLEVFADFTDLRSVYLGGHSRAVAALAHGAAEVAGCPPADIVAVRRAGLVHDVGRVATSAAVWGKQAPLSSSEREAVRLHPYYTERVLARPDWLSGLGHLGSLHHERLDGTGYFRGCRGLDQPLTARLLAAADFLQTQTERRPYREATPLPEASTLLREEVTAGRLDPDAVDAVLTAAGAAPSRRRRTTGDLTPREVEVVRLLARGATKAQVARALVIAPKTADAHTQHIYAKLGVTTRSGMTLYAMRHGLLDTLTADDSV